MIRLTPTQIILPPQIIERPTYTIKIFPDTLLAELIIKPDVLLDEAFARNSKDDLEQARPGHKYYLLVASEGFFRLTKKARLLGASKNFSNHLAAVGCYTTNFSLALLGELYNKINKPVVPTKVFHSRQAAAEWLLEKMNSPKLN